MILSGDENLDKKTFENKKKNFEDDKKEALFNVKMRLKEIEGYIGKMEKAKEITFKKDRGRYIAEINFTGDIQWALNKIKESLEELAERYDDLEAEESDLEG